MSHPEGLWDPCRHQGRQNRKLAPRHRSRQHPKLVFARPPNPKKDPWLQAGFGVCSSNSDGDSDGNDRGTFLLYLSYFRKGRENWFETA